MKRSYRLSLPGWAVPQREEYFEKMAARGLFVKKCGFYLTRFEKGEPCSVCYRLDAARSLARDTGAIVVLKGHRTVTAAPDGRTWINTSGNAGMATGGSGDTLAGILAAFLGQKLLYSDGTDAAQLTAWAVWLHGAAGDHAARRLGEYSLLPDDLIDALPQVLREHVVD